MDMEQSRVRTPLFPLYSTVRHLLRLLEGVPKELFLRMMNAINQQTGTPQNPVDWRDPDQWVEKRLSGEEAALATHIWQESRGEANPRHLYGTYLLISRYDLLEEDFQRLFSLTEDGRAFLTEDRALIRYIDECEGIPQLLSILSTKVRAKRGDLLPDWGEFLERRSKFGTASTIKDTLRRRLLNVVERGYVERDGIFYVITQAGLKYVDNIAAPYEIDKKREVLRAINTFNEEQRLQLRNYLSTMHPYRFEHLIRELLEAMGYEDVEVTKESGDRGVDVIATIQFGITTIKEVVQVKRHQGTIGRPILDQLRGALPYHDAIRGTIITLSRFSQECIRAALYPGAAPIGLIDGEKLLDLLFEHQIGLRKSMTPVYEIDEEFFDADDPEDPEALIK